MLLLCRGCSGSWTQAKGEGQQGRAKDPKGVLCPSEPSPMCSRRTHGESGKALTVPFPSASRWGRTDGRRFQKHRSCPQGNPRPLRGHHAGRCAEATGGAVEVAGGRRPGDVLAAHAPRPPAAGQRAGSQRARWGHRAGSASQRLPRPVSAWRPKSRPSGSLMTTPRQLHGDGDRSTFS